MDIGLSVDGDTLILWKLFTPGFTSEAVNRPIVPVKAAPQNRAAVLIYILLGSHRIVEALDVHHANSIIRLIADGHPKNRVPYLAHDFIISSFQLTPKATLDCFVRWFAVPHFCILLQ